jgi:serine/threonine protein kinase
MATSDNILVLSPGTVLDGRYEIVSLIGLGGMGSVYKAKHTVLETTFAIKLLHPQSLTADVLTRFKQEAKAISLVQHRNIVAVHDYGVAPEGVPYLVMEFLEGPSLADVIKKEGALNEERFLHVFGQVCDGLAHAHNKGLIHRDLKPENIILVTRDHQIDIAKLVDFGVAKFMPIDGTQSARLTRTGEVVGSPLYMSPEQCIGKELDVRSDIYSLGCVMHIALTGSETFHGESALQVMHQHVHDSAAISPEVKANERLKQVILKCLRKDPAERYQSALELKQALEAAKSGGLLRAPSKFLPALMNKKYLQPIVQSAIATTVVTSVAIAIRVTGQHVQNVAVNTIAQSMPASPPPSLSPVKFFEQGVRLKEQGKYSEAIGCFNRALDISPRYPEALKARAESYYRLTDYSNAIEDYSQLLAAQPDSAPLHLARAEAYQHTNESLKAVTDAQIAAELDPNNPRPLFTLAEANSTAGNHREAIQVLTHIARMTPSDSAVYCNRAAEHSALKEWTEALDDYSKALKLTPTSARAYAGRGQVYQETGQYKKAITDFNKALELDKSYSWVLPLRDKCSQHLK